MPAGLRRNTISAGGICQWLASNTVTVIGGKTNLAKGINYRGKDGVPIDLLITDSVPGRRAYEQLLQSVSSDG